MPLSDLSIAQVVAFVMLELVSLKCLIGFVNQRFSFSLVCIFLLIDRNRVGLLIDQTLTTPSLPCSYSLAWSANPNVTTLKKQILVSKSQILVL